MSIMSNYYSPEFDVINLHHEGVLCVSDNQVTGSSTESFDSITDFEW